MIWKFTLLFAAGIILISTKVFGQGKDSIFLYNGQVLIGKIKGGQLGEITIDDDDLKVIQVKQYKIKVLKTSRRFKIETHSKKKYFGILQQSEKPGKVIIKLDNTQSIELEITDLNDIIGLEKDFFERLDGNLSAGFTYNKSNDLGQINLSAAVQYVSESFQYQASVSANESIDSSAFSRDREDAGIFVTYSFKTTWFIAAGLSYQRNLELSIARRFQELIGGGNKIFVRKNWQLLALSGLTLNEEKSSDGISNNLLLEIPAILRFDYFKYHHPDIQINSSQSAFFSLSQAGRIRFDCDINFSWELARHFYLTLNPYANFDNQPPQGNSNSDFGLAINFSYKF